MTDTIKNIPSHTDTIKDIPSHIPTHTDTIKNIPSHTDTIKDIPSHIPTHTDTIKDTKQDKEILPPPLPLKTSSFPQNIEPFNVKRGHLELMTDEVSLEKGCKKISQIGGKTFLHCDDSLIIQGTLQKIPYKSVSIINEIFPNSLLHSHIILLVIGSSAMVVSILNPLDVLHLIEMDFIISSTLYIEGKGILLIDDSGQTMMLLADESNTKKNIYSTTKNIHKETLLDSPTTVIQSNNHIILASNHGRWIEIRLKDSLMQLPLHSRFQWREYSSIPDDLITMFIDSNHLLWTIHRCGVLVCWEFEERIRIIKILRIVNPIDEEITSSFYSGGGGGIAAASGDRIYIMLKRSTPISYNSMKTTSKTKRKKHFKFFLQEFHLKKSLFISSTEIDVHHENILSFTIMDSSIILLLMESCHIRMFKIVFSNNIVGFSKAFSIRALSWNVDAQLPPEISSPFWNEWFGFDSCNGAGAGDLLLIGLQEIIKLNDKKLGAKTLFKDLKNGSGAPLPTALGYRWSARIGDLLMKDWIKVGEHCLVGLWSSIWRRRVNDSSSSDDDDDDPRKNDYKITFKAIKRGFSGLHGNKGAIIGRIMIGGNVIMFINCHLAAGHLEYQKRGDDVKAILYDSNDHHHQSHHYDHHHDHNVPLADNHNNHCTMATLNGVNHCIFIGDLNYRAMFSSKDEMRLIERGISNATSFNGEMVDWPSLSLKYDQLKLLTSNPPPTMIPPIIPSEWGHPLKAFDEGMITFPPTYKYQRGSMDLALNDGKRYPSWCDRILYRNCDYSLCLCNGLCLCESSTKASNIKEYKSYPTILISDHRPISAQIDIILRR